MFRALVLQEPTDKKSKPKAAIEELSDDQLPEDGDVTVNVLYSTVNYKDGMIINGLGKLVREYPHVPGIDFVGTVETSENPRYTAGQHVILNGWRVGEVHWGGYAEKARVRGSWLVPMPEGFTPEDTMILGTAGYTAMLAVMALEHQGLSPEAAAGREVLVTGAAGGVGSIAVALLSSLGYNVTASTGREETHPYLQELGAKNIIHRNELNEPGTRPLESERWVGCIDNVGGTTLARVIAQTALHGSVAAVGLASGNELHTNVIPFLLRGVSLVGIDSATCPFHRRVEAWRRLGRELPKKKLQLTHSETVGLDDLPALADRILQGQVRGRVLVDVRK
ncbi:MAG: MDR family oxidoreductase [Planctomycetota bacterium]